MTATLIAYHGNKKLKSGALKKMREHRKADRIIQAFGYWAEDPDDGVWKGCAVGCLIESGRHSEYEPQFGIPALLAHLEDGIFESLPATVAKDWPVRFLNAIPVGADLSTVWPQFVVWLMIDETWGLVNATEAEDVKEVCRKVAAGYQQIALGGISEADAAEITKDARDAFTVASADKLIEILKACG